MEIYHKVTVHLQKLCQHLVRKFRCKDLQIRNCSHRAAHLKIFSILKYKTGRCNIILGTKPCPKHIIIGEMERNFAVLVKSFIHDL